MALAESQPRARPTVVPGQFFCTEIKSLLRGKLGRLESSTIHGSGDDFLSVVGADDSFDSTGPLSAFDRQIPCRCLPVHPNSGLHRVPTSPAEACFVNAADQPQH